MSWLMVAPVQYRTAGREVEGQSRRWWRNELINAGSDHKNNSNLEKINQPLASEPQPKLNNAAWQDQLLVNTVQSTLIPSWSG